ncbi:MAG: indole-3-glycerol phosphate synthase TrpC [Vicinamibacterales bacterium]
MRASLLRTIVAATERAVTERETKVPLAGLRVDRAPRRPAHAFRAAFDGTSLRPRIIAECKRRSPSKGILREAYDPAAIAAAYEEAGAAAVSVLTEPAFFDGALEHLTAVRAAVTIPVLRKDFIVSRYQIAEARAAGADAVLLILAALSDEALIDLLQAAREFDLDTLVETHDRAEIARAVDAGAEIIGVNSRNLHTLKVDPNLARELAAAIPSTVIGIAESGIRDATAVSSLSAAGYRGVLIGEQFMTAPDPGAALRELLDGVPDGGAEDRSGAKGSPRATRPGGVQGTPPEI